MGVNSIWYQRYRVAPNRNFQIFLIRIQDSIETVRMVVRTMLQEETLSTKQKGKYEFKQPLKDLLLLSGGLGCNQGLLMKLKRICDNSTKIGQPKENFDQAQNFLNIFVPVTSGIHILNKKPEKLCSCYFHCHPFKVFFY